jgi:hypothetical protein
MSKSSKKPSDDAQRLKPEMRDLILRFDAKDRRDEDDLEPVVKERRRRGDKAPRAA